MNSLLSQFEKDVIDLYRRSGALNTASSDISQLTQIEQAKQLEEIARALGAIVSVLEAIEGNLSCPCRPKFPGGDAE